MPGLVADSANKTVLGAILLQPLVNLVTAIRNVMTRVEIESLSVLVVRATRRRGLISFPGLKQRKQFSLSLESTKGAVNRKRDIVLIERGFGQHEIWLETIKGDLFHFTAKADDVDQQFCADETPVLPTSVGSFLILPTAREIKIGTTVAKIRSPRPAKLFAGFRLTIRHVELTDLDVLFVVGVVGNHDKRFLRNRFGRRSETRRAFTNDGLGIDTGLTFAIGRHLEVARRKAGGLISESAGQIHRRCPAEDFRSVSGQPRKNEDMPVGVGLDVSHINFGTLL